MGVTVSTDTLSPRPSGFKSRPCRFTVWVSQECSVGHVQPTCQLGWFETTSDVMNLELSIHLILAMNQCYMQF